MLYKDDEVVFRRQLEEVLNDDDFEVVGPMMISEEEVLANPGLAEELNEMKRKIAAKRALH